jgi:hypothetical protein
MARFLDDYAAPPGGPGRDAVEMARCRLSEWIARTDREVQSHDSLQCHLGRAAGALTELLAESPSEQIQDAIAAIKRCAAGAKPDDGDGLAHFAQATDAPCLCGFLDLARRVEDRAQSYYDAADGSLRAWPAIAYKTILTPDTLKTLAPFNIGGGADITSTRRVTLTVKDVALSAIDLCQIAYVLFHEVVCHGFQGLLQAAPVNAKPKCHWSEGWMDAVAYRLAVASANGHKNDVREWLPLTGPDAESAMGNVHNARYTDPAGLKSEDAKERRAARKAFSELQLAFVSTGIAASEADAAVLAQKFSLLANARADSKMLIKLSALLQTVLLSKFREDDKVYASNACLEFLQHRDVTRLLTNLQTLSKVPE